MERRKHKRVPLATLVRLRIAGVNRYTKLETKDLSAGGIFVQTDYPPPVGTKVKIDLVLGPLETTIRVRGEVLRNGGPGGPGMGIEFKRLGKRKQRMIEQAVEDFSQKHPQESN